MSDFYLSHLLCSSLTLTDSSDIEFLNKNKDRLSDHVKSFFEYTEELKKWKYFISTTKAGQQTKYLNEISYEITIASLGLSCYNFSLGLRHFSGPCHICGKLPEYLPHQLCSRGPRKGMLKRNIKPPTHELTMLKDVAMCDNCYAGFVTELIKEFIIQDTKIDYIFKNSKIQNLIPQNLHKPKYFIAETIRCRNATPHTEYIVAKHRNSKCPRCGGSNPASRYDHDYFRHLDKKMQSNQFFVTPDGNYEQFELDTVI